MTNELRTPVEEKTKNVPFAFILSDTHGDQVGKVIDLGDP
jgi:hypothetical protein